MTTLIEQQETQYKELQEAHDHEVDALRRRSRLATTAATVFALALLGLGIFVMADRGSTPVTALSNEVQQVVDDYHDAWNAYDVEAFDELTTNGYVHRNRLGQFDKDTQMQTIEGLGGSEWHVAKPGDAIMAGDGPWYVAVMSDITYSVDDGEGQGISLLTIVDDGGVLKVSRHVYNGDL